MTKKILSRTLRIADVPALDADWLKISEFALTYDPKESSESFRSYGSLAEISPDSSISELREVLYLQQRLWNHYSEEPDEDSMKKIHEIISLLHKKLQKP